MTTCTIRHGFDLVVCGNTAVWRVFESFACEACARVTLMHVREYWVPLAGAPRRELPLRMPEDVGPITAWG